MLIALSAIVVGVCALIVSVVQVRIMRQEQHTAVWPRLHVEQHYARGRYLRFVLVNQGLGPAVIEDVRVTVDGAPRTRWAAVIETLVPGHAPHDLAIAAIDGRILPAGEALTAFGTADTLLADAMAGAMGRVVMEACYCSVYEQCWIMTRPFEDGRSPAYERTGACPASGAGRFVD